MNLKGFVPKIKILPLSKFMTNTSNEKPKRGRKPITDCSKRVPLRVMVEMCTINEWGGMKRAQMYVQDFLERGPDELPKRKRDCI